MKYRLFKATYKDRAGKARESAKWYVEFRDHMQTVRRLAGFTSKSATDELGRNLIKLVEYHGATGGQVDPALSRWLAGLPAGIREKLVAIGLLGGERVAAGKPLVDHVTDWTNALTAKTTSAKHVALLKTRLNKLIAGCGFKFFSDISATKVQAYLADLRTDTDEERGISIQTSNFYLGALKQFCKWMVKHGRALSNPVDHLEPLNVKLDRRHDRRALAVDEVKKLLSATASGPDRYGMPGPERRLLYLLALETGLRANELRSLTRASFDLNDESPTVTVCAAYSKRRREDTLPLRPALVVELRVHLANKLPAAPAFNTPGHPMFTRMFQQDIDAAGITYRDEDDRVADFQLFRALHASGGVVLYDEAERLRQSTPDQQEIQSMFLSGYRRGGCAMRNEAVGDSFRPVRFDVFGPKALACIAGLPPTLASRCIPVTMFRSAADSDKPKRRLDADPAAWQSVRDDLHVLALEHGPTWVTLAARKDVVPSGIGGRNYELWQPLLALAAWLEERGADGLFGLVQAHARASVAGAKDDAIPEADEVLLEILAERVRSLDPPTTAELLAAAKLRDEVTFKLWHPKTVSARLKNYGIAPSPKANGERRYRDVTPSQLAQIQQRYGVELGFQ